MAGVPQKGNRRCPDTAICGDFGLQIKVCSSKGLGATVGGPEMVAKRCRGPELFPAHLAGRPQSKMRLRY